jgi:histidine phosphotransfer protein HptB
VQEEVMTDKIVDQGVYQSLVEMVGEDFIGEMVEAFLDEGAQFLNDLSGALEAEDVDTFRRAAHSLKSNAATFGALALSEMAKELEMMARENQLGSVDGKLASLSLAFKEASRVLKELQNG